MSNNFNIGQFVSSFLSFSAKAIAGKPINANAQNFQQAVPVETQVVTPQLQLKNMVEIPKVQLEMLNSLDKGALVKELMNMPKEFSQLVSMFTVTQQNGALQSSFLDMTKLISFLQQNGEVGKQNLLNLIVTINKAGFTQTEQLKELSFIINACMPSAQNSPSVIMKNLILLYLPWLPLGEGMGFDIEVRSGEEEKSGVDDDTVTIYIKTQNFGSVRVLLQVEGKSKIILKINCDEKFPKNTAEKRFKDEVESYNIQSEIEFMKDKQQLDKIAENSQTTVNVNTSNHINPLLMMAAHSIIRIVFEIDKNTAEMDSEEET